MGPGLWHGKQVRHTCPGSTMVVHTPACARVGVPHGVNQAPTCTFQGCTSSSTPPSQGTSASWRASESLCGDSEDRPTADRRCPCWPPPAQVCSWCGWWESQVQVQLKREVIWTRMTRRGMGGGDASRFCRTGWKCRHKWPFLEKRLPSRGSHAQSPQVPRRCRLHAELRVVVGRTGVSTL